METRQAGKVADPVYRLRDPRRARLAATVIAVMAFWLLMSPSAEARKPPPPAKRTYFVIFLGVMGGYESEATCLRFDRRRVCDDEECGSWEQGDIANKQSGLSFRIEFTEDDIPIVIDGSARIDDRLKKSSMGGAVKISADGQVGNFALVGREAPMARCRRLVEAFNNRSTAE